MKFKARMRGKGRLGVGTPVLEADTGGGGKKKGR